MNVVWDASADPSAVGYKIYYGGASRNYTNLLDAGTATSAIVSNLAAGVTYFFAATAYNSEGMESDYSDETSYTVQPQALNRPPTLNQPANLTINENSGLQTVTLSGISSGSASEDQTLAVTAFSDNTGVVPQPQVAYTSPGSTAQLSFTPAHGSYGVAAITVMVDDSGNVSNTVLRSFNVTVLPVNNPPTLDPPGPLTIEEGAGLQTVVLSGISAGSGETQNLTVSASSSNPGLIPSPNVQYSSPNATGTLTFAPTTNSFGWARLTVTVSDGQPTNALFTQSFVVTVNQNNSGSSNGAPIAAWSMWFERTNGYTAVWNMDGTNRQDGGMLSIPKVAPSWRMAAQADFNGDGRADVVWQHTSGTVSIWFMNDTNCIGTTTITGTPSGQSWKVAAAGDLDGDGIPDLLWQHSSGQVVAWFMDGTNCTRRSNLNPSRPGNGWRLAAAADFNNDHRTDLLWQYPTGIAAVWFMDGTNCIGQVQIAVPPAGKAWRIVGTADLTAAGHNDILWQNDNTGDLAYWLMNGTVRSGSGSLNPHRVESAWRAMGPR